ncbi:MAG: prenyltransferase/squalene oxidase repeat-containing protein [Bacteroidota bacterium]|nr:squalene--hopene cyclase [Odoribacter sp.]MDP3641613.1 prenyltransferase/squalene oxidase repeat-containing protein [Bacteroidota bacterium]
MNTHIQQQFDELSKLLLQKRNADGYWEGRLSSSALGVAVAITALHFYDAQGNAPEILSGLNWLKQNLNADGGFGDSPGSVSNVSTSLLCYAAAKITNEPGSSAMLLQQLGNYLRSQNIDISSAQLIRAILDFYQTDRTFSVPILTMCALCGVPGKEAFDSIPQLPFELSLLPRSFYSLLNLSVVSYAIPALVAVGIAIFRFKKKKNPVLKLVRGASVNKSLALLRKIQPESGGYLEAIPLTAFVCLCLIESGYRNLDVVRDGMAFLIRTQREDGSWPIDINLSTWVTTLAVKSVKNHPDILTSDDKQQLTNHLLSIQNKQIHPFNGTQPGGWGWTSYSGSVPDGDDTPGTILALLSLNQENPESVSKSVLSGCNWLMQLQNNDGGFPTFSRGWGKLPFDQSCSDLTGHGLLALAQTEYTYRDSLSRIEQTKFRRIVVKSLIYLKKNQSSQGFWLPLWFGNQHMADYSNPVYGTARVTAYLNETLNTPLGNEYVVICKLMIEHGCRYLISAQNLDGSWGGAKNSRGSIEETSLAITALVRNGFQEECASGIKWMAEKVKSDGIIAAPIGLYFASLWYYEELYPLTAYLECLSSVKEEFGIEMLSGT